MSARTPIMSGCSTRSTAPNPSSAGFPIWGTLIALLHKGTPVYGMMHQPFIGERFSGDNGSATIRGPSGERKLQVRRCASLKEATTYHDEPAADERRRPRHLRPDRKRGRGCRAMAAIATPIACWRPAIVDLVVETELKPYDIAALIPIVTGAGGVVTNWEGEPAQNGGRIVAAGDARARGGTEAAQGLDSKEVGASAERRPRPVFRPDGVAKLGA